MSEETKSTGLANLPKFGSFWSRPEGKTGAVTLALLGGAALLGLNYLLPILLAVAWTATKLAVLCGGLFGAWLLVSNKRLRALVSEGFQAIMDKLTRGFVKLDPYGIVRRYVKYLKTRLAMMEASIGTFMGQNQRLKQMIDSQDDTVKKQTAILQTARQRRGDNDPLVQKTARQVGRLQNSNEKLQKEYDRNAKALAVLKKLHEQTKYVIEDSEEAVEVEIRTHAAISASQAAFASAVDIINGDPAKKEMFDASMEFMAEDIAQKIGRIEMGYETIQDALSSKELENDAAAAEVLRRLDEAERDTDGIRTMGKKTERPALGPAQERVTAPETENVVENSTEFETLFTRKK